MRDAHRRRFPYTKSPLYKFLFRPTRVHHIPRGGIQRIRPGHNAPGQLVHASPFNELHALRSHRNPRLLSRKWAGRPEPARALYWQLHPGQVRPRYTLDELLAQLPDGPLPRLPEWESAPPVGREIID